MKTEVAQPGGVRRPSLAVAALPSCRQVPRTNTAIAAVVHFLIQPVSSQTHPRRRQFQSSPSLLTLPTAQFSSCRHQSTAEPSPWRSPSSVADVPQLSLVLCSKKKRIETLIAARQTRVPARRKEEIKMLVEKSKRATR
ncbi:hypothetical protein M0R45_006750 [Rubus argutus]|uniref:Uncharacterized protein n=1 Tax=Rubus argutus TaxID=59490 RepID=A0AAW1YS15_RUBAR